MRRVATANRRSRRGRNVWVVRFKQRFSIREEGCRRHLIPPVTQRTAVAIARLLARANRSELIVQGRSGRILFRDSHGPDPFPPRG